MGFYKKDYYNNRRNLYLPSAYAIIKDLKIYKKIGFVTFVVQKERDESFTSEEYGNICLYFDINRNENPYITAYKKAKEKKEIIPAPYIDENGKTVQRKSYFLNMPFADWEDDYGVNNT